MNDLLVKYAGLGTIETVKVLLELGADVHASNDKALLCASNYGHVEVVKILLDAGANVHAFGGEALRWASRSGHTEVVRVLQEHLSRTENNTTNSTNNS